MSTLIRPQRVYSVERMILHYRLGLVLVLSIAVLVLVLDSVLSRGLFSLDQSGQHRDDPFQVRFA